MKRHVIWLSVILSIFFLAAGIIPAENNAGLGNMGRKLVSLWPDKTCGVYLSSEDDYDMLSLACRQGYSEGDRQLFLDLLFKNGYSLKKESYQLETSSGFYLYKTVSEAEPVRPVFFKLYFRDAVVLWPDQRRSPGNIVVFVQDLADEKQLIQWQTLGISLSYGLVPFKTESQEIGQKIRDYGQELWLSLPLEPVKVPVGYNRMLRVTDLQNPEKVSRFLDEAFGSVGPVTGVATSKGDLFLANVYAVRSLLEEIKNRQVEHFLDNQAGASNTSGYETAQIMSLHAYRSDLLFRGNRDLAQMEKSWEEILRSSRDRGLVRIVVAADDQLAWAFLRQKIAANQQRKENGYRFLRLTEGY